VIPLTVLEAVRSADLVTTVSGFDDVDEVPAVRLGGSPTVLAQIERYQGLARRGARVTSGDVGGILKLIGRRRDADLVMAEAGRRAGEFAATSQVGRLSRLVHGLAPPPMRRRLGASIVRRAAKSVLDVDISRESVARWTDPGELITSSGVRACEIFRAATAELLRRFTTFDGALFHVSCKEAGDDACVWSAQPNNEETAHAE